MVPGAGVEPARYFYRGILSLAHSIQDNINIIKYQLVSSLINSIIVVISGRLLPLTGLNMVPDI
jgi:hypothetical protein